MRYSSAVNRAYYAIFNKRISKNIDMSFRLREKTDYQDFVMISRDMAEEQINKAKEVLLEVKPYVVSIWEKEE